MIDNKVTCVCAYHTLADLPSDLNKKLLVGSHTRHAPVQLSVGSPARAAPTIKT
jgi:hypothetical protein